MKIPEKHFDRIYSAPFTVPQRRYVQPPHPLIPRYSEETDGAGLGSLGGQSLSQSGAQASLVFANAIAISQLQNMINGATINAVCNGDGTITVTLNWGNP